MGLRGVELSQWIWSRQHPLRWNGRDFLQRERFFLVRVGSHDPDRSGNDEQELRVIEEIRWWPVAEIAASAEAFSPPGLAGLLASLPVGPEPICPLEIEP